MSFNFKMEERRWEELEMDCLLNVFGRVGMESLLLDVPFVCKSWHKTSLEPLCWQSLMFPAQPITCDALGNSTDSGSFETFMERFLNEYQIDESRFSITDFIKFVVNRSRGHATMLRLPATMLRLPAYCTETAIKYVAEMCPDLKVLALPMYLVRYKSSIIHELISKWKDLEWLVLGSSFDLGKILSQVSVSCKNFCCLSVLNAFIHQDEAMAIVNILPNLKKLSLRKAYKIDREALLTLLRGCKELVFFDVRDCVGFDEGDEEILKLASHITKFSCEGSTVLDEDDCYGGNDYEQYDGYNSG